MHILRIGECKAAAGYRSNASIHQLIRAGLWTRPVSISARAVGWPDTEVKALVMARIAGQSEADIRALVGKLHSQRAQLAQSLD